MADVSDMMLDGTLCACCGEYLGDAVGYAVLCEGCASPEGPAPKAARVKCADCGKFVSEQGLHDHRRAKHGK